jgi:tRNA(Arg) A34 adenosine deaminase TadA
MFVKDAKLHGAGSSLYNVIVVNDLYRISAVKWQSRFHRVQRHGGMQVMVTERQDEDSVWMRLAIEEARAAVAAGNHPYGSVIVLDGTVVGRGGNAEVTANDPTAHAETVAIRAACGSLGRLTLGGATLYASGEPCQMCATAARLTGISRVVIGSFSSDSARYWQRHSRGVGAPYEQIVGVLREDCAKLFDA